MASVGNFLAGTSTNGDAKSGDKEKTDQEKTMEVYYAFITVGITTFLWKDAIQMLDRVKINNGSLAPGVAIYFTIAITSMVLGMVACKFPESAPLPMGTAGHGAFHALLFMVLGMHLDTFVYHGSYLWALGCVLLTGFLFTVYWGCSVEDPVMIQACVQFLWWLASWAWSKLQQVPDCVCSLWKRLVSKLRSYRVPPPDPENENKDDSLYEKLDGSPRSV
uniref:Uncharacterized protein n=1 Tax=Avena sativa TaxID=4498 RepID=A0ACD5W6P4_AVESA